MNKKWTVDELERMAAEHEYYEMKMINDWEKQRIQEDAVERFKRGEDFSKERPEEILELIRRHREDTKKKAPKKRVAKSNTMPNPIKDVYIPPADGDGVIDLGQVYEQITEMLCEEGLAHLDDAIQDGITNLNEMYTRGQLQTILLGVLHDLIKQGGNDFVLIKHDAARKMYEQYSDIINKMHEAKTKAEERIEMRENALKKLTAAERELLGL